jgi:hypothetical protein
VHGVIKRSIRVIFSAALEVAEVEY